MIGTRIRLINQMRAFCLEYGIALRQGAGLFKLDLPQALDDQSNDLSSAMRKLLADLITELRQLEQRIRDVTREIEAIASREDVARRLMTIPGIGALGATALLSAVGNGRQFQKVRDLACLAGPGASRVLDRRKAEASRHQQARKSLRSQSARTWRRVLSMGQGVPQNGLFQRGKVNLNGPKLWTSLGQPSINVGHELLKVVS